jgi:Fe2+ or Zn2+ uptake regulation protein
MRTRERVVGLPNLRDNGMTIDRHLLNLIGRLQHRWGHAFASEAGLRWMIFEDTGKMPGLDTVRRALKRLEVRGLIVQLWLYRGGIMPDGGVCTAGTRCIALRVAGKGRYEPRNRNQGVSGRVNHRALHSLTQARKAIAKELAPGPRELTPQEKFDRARRDAQARLAELAKASPDDKPPDT